MGEKLALCLFLICLQGGIEERLKVGRGGGGNWASLGHEFMSRAREQGCGWQREGAVPVWRTEMMRESHGVKVQRDNLGNKTQLCTYEEKIEEDSEESKNWEALLGTYIELFVSTRG